MLFFWLFLLLPILEIFVLIEVGQEIGALSTIALIILTAVVGSAMVRRQGLAAWRETQSSLAQLEDPSRPIAHGAMIFMAGILLIVPGFVTDAMGVLLLLPFVREWVLAKMGKRIIMAPGFGAARRESYPGGRVIDADFVVVDDGGPTADTDILPPHGGDDPSNGPRRPPSGWTRS